MAILAIFSIQNYSLSITWILYKGRKVDPKTIKKTLKNIQKALELCLSGV